MQDEAAVAQKARQRITDKISGDENNCKSLNHIMKLDARWKPGNTHQIIELLHDIVSLRFRDFRGTLYGNGNYRLVAN